MIILGKWLTGLWESCFSDLSADAVIGDVSVAVLEKRNQLLKRIHYQWMTENSDEI